MSRSGRTRLLRTLVAVCVCAFVLVLVIFVCAAPIAQRLLRRDIVSRGLSETLSVRVRSVGLHVCELGPVQVGDGPDSVRLSSVFLHYRPLDLFRGRIESVEIVGVNVPIRVASGTLEIPFTTAVQRIVAAYGSESSDATDSGEALPELVSVRHGELRLQLGDDGDHRIPFDLHTRREGRTIMLEGAVDIGGGELACDAEVALPTGVGHLSGSYTNEFPARLWALLRESGLVTGSLSAVPVGLAAELAVDFRGWRVATVTGSARVDRVELSSGAPPEAAVESVTVEMNCTGPFEGTAWDFSGTVGSIRCGGVSADSVEWGGTLASDAFAVTVPETGIRSDAGESHGRISGELRGTGLHGNELSVNLSLRGNGVVDVKQPVGKVQVGSAALNIEAQGLPRDAAALAAVLHALARGRGTERDGTDIRAEIRLAEVRADQDAVLSLSNGNAAAAVRWDRDGMSVEPLLQQGEQTELLFSAGPVRWEGLAATSINGGVVRADASGLYLSGEIVLEQPDTDIFWTAELPLPLSGTVRATATATPLRVSTEDAWLKPWWSRRDIVMSGVMGGKAEVVLGSAPASAKATVTVRDGRVAVPGKDIEVTGIRTDLAFVSLEPLRTAFTQMAAFDKAAVGGAEFVNGRIEYALQDAGKGLIQSAHIGWCGGELAAYSVPLDLVEPALDVTLYAKELELPRVLSAIRGVRCEGEGRLYGFLPLSYQKGRVAFGDGFLYSVPGEKGVLKMKALGPLETALQGSGRDMETVRKALKNFEYELLRIDVNGTDSGDPGVAITFIGSEADGRGRPVHLDVNIRGALTEVLNWGLRVSGVGPQ